MFLKITKLVGKPVCTVLWAAFGWLAAKKKPLPLLILFALHLVETFTKGREVAKAKGVAVTIAPGANSISVAVEAITCS